MLKQATIDKIAAFLKMDAVALKEAISHKDEKDLDIPENLQVFDEAALAARDRNKYQEGKTAGEEMLIKDIKRKHEIQVDGDTPDKVIEALIAKSTASVGGKPGEKEAELQRQIDHWKKQHEDALGETTTLKQKMAMQILDNELLSLLPKSRDSKISDAEYLTLIKSQLQITEDNGKKVVMRDGKKLEDPKSLEPISVKDAIDGYFNERKWIDEGAGAGQQQRQGAGGGNSKVGGSGVSFSKMSEVQAHLKEQGINPSGSEGQAFIAAITKDNPEIDYLN